MRHVPAGLVLSLVLALSGADAIAAMHITDVQGGEVVVRRGPAPPPIVRATSRGRIGPHATVNVSSGPDTDAANNDFRRIQNAINAAGNGDTIILAGTFDFTRPFAAAAWALGNDNTAATFDDYSVYVPQNLNGVTLTATTLGSATIQGPGDLAALDLEGFLYFDGGDNQNWTISNLQIYDFDLGIGMFNGAGGSDAFNGTVITNNLVRIPVDLNATVAPGDTVQNIGIHFSFGINQSILSNTIQFAGNGVSNGANFSSEVGMQSNTSGGAVYNGLQINGNQLLIPNAQSGNPQTMLGIWENGHAHLSNITLFDNHFLNTGVGNDPAVNIQRGFRVTSHSGVATTVLYDRNNVVGANIGFQWLAASNFAGNQAVVMNGNTVTACATGVLVQSNGIAHLNRNEIVSSGAGGGIHVITGMLTGSGANTNALFRNKVTNGLVDGVWIEVTAGAVAPIAENDLGNNAGFGLRNESAPSILAERNWWGNNLAAAVAAEVSGNADFDPWLASGTDLSGLFGFQPFVYATTSGAITTFVGTGGADTGAVLAGDPVTMQLNGETAFTALAQLLNFDIQPGASDDAFTLGQTGIPTAFNGGPGNDTIVGTNVAQTWNITGAGSGNIPGAATSFQNVENLRGGTAADSFVFGAAGSLAQSLDGNLGIDTLNNSAIPAATVTPTGPGTLDGFMGTATGIGTSFDNINLVAGSPADLAVSKTGPAGPVPVSSVISYTITVMNNGPNPALNASLADVIPAGTTFASFTSAAGWSCTTPAVNGTGTVTCTRLSVPLGPHVFTLNINAPAAAGPVSNTATVASANDPTPGNNSSTALTTVSVLADLAVTKTATPTADAGTNVTYNISLTNNGPNAATGVSLSDALPANTTFVSTTQNTGPAFVCSNPAGGTNGTVTCTNASFANAATATFTIVAAIAPGAPAGPLGNTATVTSTSTDLVPLNNSSTASTTVTIAADVSVVKTAPATAAAATNISYGITVTNAGPSNAPNVSLTDTLPPNTTFVSNTQNSGPTFSCTNPAVGGTGTVNCTLASLAPATPATFTLVVAVNPAAPTGALPNTAAVSTTATDGTPANNSSTATTTITLAAADVSITKTASAGPYTTGNAITYTIVVANAGPGAATNVVVTDILPAGATFNSATPTQGSCAGTATVTCTLGTLANGASASIALVVTPNSSGSLSNTATVTATNTDGNAGNNASTAVIAIDPAAVVPTLSPSLLLLMALALALAGWIATRR